MPVLRPGSIYIHDRVDTDDASPYSDGGGHCWTMTQLDEDPSGS